MTDDPVWREGDLVRAVELLSDTFAARSIPYALLGGLALGFRGNPRFTQDVDIESLLSANRDTIGAALNRSEWAAVADSDDERTVWLAKAISRFVPAK